MALSLGVGTGVEGSAQGILRLCVAPTPRADTARLCFGPRCTLGYEVYRGFVVAVLTFFTFCFPRGHSLMSLSFSEWLGASTASAAMPCCRPTVRRPLVPRL